MLIYSIKSPKINVEQKLRLLCMKKRILVVDDSLTQLTSLKLSLVKYGYEVLTANNGEEGIFVAYEHLPDLIVADIIMPQIDGYQFCRLLKNDERTKHIPIILLTQLNQRLDKFWGLRTGANAFLNKDKDLTKLASTVENFLFSSIESKQEQLNEVLDAKKFLSASEIHLKVKQIFDQTLIESTIVNEFRNLSEYLTDSNLLSKEIHALIGSIIDCNAVCVFFNDRDSQKIKELTLSLYNIDPGEKVFKELKKNFFYSLLGDEYLVHDSFFNHTIIEKTNNELFSCEEFSHLASKIIIPIVYSGKVLGGIALYHIEANKFQSTKMFNLILKELKVLMRMKWLYSETEYLTITDGLTGIYNRRFFQQTIDREFLRAKRYKHSLSVAMIDVDNFKKINDTYGHQFGDKILVRLSEIIRDSFRKTDYVARYGGEEFAVILPETNKASTYIPIERIRQKVESEKFEYKGKIIPVTISIGISDIKSAPSSCEELINSSDETLYKAKNNGKNRIELSADLEN